jgi:hypothetical protein
LSYKEGRRCFGLLQLCITVPAVDMFYVNTHACRELTCRLHMNRPNLHNAELLLTVAVRRQNVWSFPAVTRCYEQRTSKRTESCLGVRIPFLLARYGTVRPSVSVYKHAVVRCVTMLSSTIFTCVSVQPHALLSTHICAVGSHET